MQWKPTLEFQIYDVAKLEIVGKKKKSQIWATDQLRK